jgi:hypothetical protein
LAPDFPRDRTTSTPWKPKANPTITAFATTALALWQAGMVLQSTKISVKNLKMK